MPTVQGTDDFNHGDFTVPGGASYSVVTGSPAKDTTITHDTDPASLLLSASAAAENVQHLITGSPLRPWQGYWYRHELADEPAGDILIMNLGCADGNGGRMSYQASSDKFYHYIAGGSEFPVSAVYGHGTWVWMEHIVDASGATRTIYTRVGGVDLTPSNRALAASTGVDCLLGNTGATTWTSRYSNHKWGTASSNSDWLGEPAPPGGSTPIPRILRSSLRW